MTAQQFREQRRAYGVMVPIAEVPAHLACGWRLVGDAEDFGALGDRVLLRPPLVFLESRACAA